MENRLLVPEIINNYPINCCMAHSICISFHHSRGQPMIDINVVSFAYYKQISNMSAVSVFMPKAYFGSGFQFSNNSVLKISFAC